MINCRFQEPTEGSTTDFGIPGISYVQLSKPFVSFRLVARLAPEPQDILVVYSRYPAEVRTDGFSRPIRS